MITGTISSIGSMPCRMQSHLVTVCTCFETVYHALKSLRCNTAMHAAAAHTPTTIHSVAQSHMRMPCDDCTAPETCCALSMPSCQNRPLLQTTPQRTAARCTLS